MQIDINCDCGEAFGRYPLGFDEEVMKYITSANIACGFHAADPVVMQKTVRYAKKNGVKIGAHVGFPDLQGFGRRNMELSEEELRCCVLYQLGALEGFCRAEGVKISHVKPHGAMYNMAAKDASMAETICQAVKDFDENLLLLGLSGSCMEKAAEKIGLAFASEAFADRAYEADGSLVSRKKAGSVIKDSQAVCERVRQMVEKGTVTAITGETVHLRPDSICVHGDNESALELVKNIWKSLM